MKLEQRSLSGSLRAAASDDRFELHGLAAAYNVPSRDLGGFVECVAPGAFKRVLREGQDVKCLFNHSADAILGRVGNRTLSLADSPEGLRFAVKLNPESQQHRDLYASVKRGDVSECSFAFAVDDAGQKWEQRNGKRYRTLTDIKLLADVSCVVYPAYPTGTSVEARSLDYALSANVADAEWEAIKARIRAIGVKVLEDRQAKVEDLTLRAEVERIGRELRRDTFRERLQLALEEFDV